MPFNFFKEVKVRCELCKNIIISESETEWTSCPCGSTKVMGLDSFVKVDGKKYTNLTTFNYDDLPARHNA